MSRKQTIPPSNDVEIDGLISEILERPRKDLDEDYSLRDGTLQALMLCKRKIQNCIPLMAGDRKMIEKIYSYMCR